MNERTDGQTDRSRTQCGLAEGRHQMFPYTPFFNGDNSTVRRFLLMLNSDSIDHLRVLPHQHVSLVTVVFVMHACNATEPTSSLHTVTSIDPCQTYTVLARLLQIFAERYWYWLRLVQNLTGSCHNRCDSFLHVSQQQLNSFFHDTTLLTNKETDKQQTFIIIPLPRRIKTVSESTKTVTMEKKTVSETMKTVTGIKEFQNP